VLAALSQLSDESFEINNRDSSGSPDPNGRQAAGIDEPLNRPPRQGEASRSLVEIDQERHLTISNRSDSSNSA
jgi:hypothetical protein